MKRIISAFIAVAIALLLLAGCAKADKHPEWSEAEGYYYKEGYEYTIEIVRGGTDKELTFDIIFYDAADNMVAGLYQCGNIDGNSIFAEHDGKSYVVQIDGKGDDRHIIVITEGGDGYKDLDGSYYLIMG